MLDLVLFVLILIARVVQELSVAKLLLFCVHKVQELRHVGRAVVVLLLSERVLMYDLIMDKPVVLGGLSVKAMQE